MAKFGVGVGEEFPVDEPPQGERSRPRDSERSCGRHGRDYGGRFGWLHFTLHVLFRVAIIGLVIAAAVSLFLPHNYPYASYPPHGFYPYHRHFFFPLFPLLLIFVLAMVWRRGRWRHRHHWDDERRGDGRGEA